MQFLCDDTGDIMTRLMALFADVYYFLIHEKH